VWSVDSMSGQRVLHRSRWGRRGPAVQHRVAPDSHSIAVNRTGTLP
jgi:hypothetical protein